MISLLLARSLGPEITTADTARRSLTNCNVLGGSVGSRNDLARDNREWGGAAEGGCILIFYLCLETATRRELRLYINAYMPVYNGIYTKWVERSRARAQIYAPLLFGGRASTSARVRRRDVDVRVRAGRVRHREGCK